MISPGMIFPLRLPILRIIPYNRPPCVLCHLAQYQAVDNDGWHMSWYMSVRYPPLKYRRASYFLFVLRSCHGGQDSGREAYHLLI
jgi:hypothetical protein